MDAINRLLDCLSPWFEANADVIHTSALAHDSDEETIMDLIGAAMADQMRQRDRAHKNAQRTARMRAKRAANAGRQA
jgi:hypothetical protein